MSEITRTVRIGSSHGLHARPAKLFAQAAKDAGIPITPQGGNTGYCGGGTPDETGEQVVLSLSRMNRIRQVDTLNYTLTAEAGCVLTTIQHAAE